LQNNVKGKKDACSETISQQVLGSVIHPLEKYVENLEKLPLTFVYWKNILQRKHDWVKY